MKCGTTSLYYDICEHPCASAAAYDEIGFFDSNFELGLNWYRSLFPTVIPLLFDYYGQNIFLIARQRSKWLDYISYYYP